ncbi:trypsin-7 [Folsomia candida]|uniref:Trypsin-7 n=1 Tax=Folsomia candida TaxID=158441 RepID=A0A226EXQ1_FOLCA|nr:trypsin-7 [Folsomia candida]OXA61937.1 Trypsin-7 [Folsomia candida]
MAQIIWAIALLLVVGVSGRSLKPDDSELDASWFEEIAPIGRPLSDITSPLAPLENEEDKIVGGEPTTIEDYPYQVQLQNRGSFFCGGSIISPKHVLTAAHCTNGQSASSLSVRVGTSTRGCGGQVIQVSEIHQHPSFNRSNLNNDVSILELSSSVTIGPQVQIIATAPSGSELSAGTLTTITGWGTTSSGGSLPTQLHVVKVPIVSVADCRAAYGDKAITDNMLCAGLSEGGKDSCQGDSGGPLVVDGVQDGIVSWGYGCADPKYPGVYTKVSNYKDFITQILQRES